MTDPDNLIEAVAKAIGDARRMRCGGYPTSGEGPDPWLSDEDRIAAKAAILATLEGIREPTIEALIAGRKQTFADMTGAHLGPNCERTWQAMLTALLASMKDGTHG